MHSTVVKLIGEVLEEMNLVDKAVMITGIGCCGLHMDYIAYDTITAPHGRACAVATGMKRSKSGSLCISHIRVMVTSLPSVLQNLFQQQTVVKTLLLSSSTTVFTV